jgi:predicted ATP-dependent endonuclease of OLD family
MQLTAVTISNFRSIKELKLPLKDLAKCLVFVGVNESGKSNILRAFRHLDEDYEITSKDLRVPLNDEPVVESAFIHHDMELDDWEKKNVPARIAAEWTNFDDNLTILQSLNGVAYSLREAILKFYQPVFVVDVKKKTKQLTYRKKATGDQFTIPTHLKAVTAGAPAINVTTMKGAKSLPGLKFVDETKVPESTRAYLKTPTPQEVFDFIIGQAGERLKTFIPTIVYWQYEDSSNLPTSVSIERFKTSTDSCLPLKYMFHIAGIAEIAAELTQKAEAGVNQLRNLFERVAKETTKYFRKRWKEYKTFSFALTLNGSNVDISIRDQDNHYDFADRSDGFRRFASFLLLISGRIEAKETRDTILLMDEPELALHPSAARFLRNELIRVSESIPVYYATHSIFMVDSEDIERHYLVSKTKEVTEVERASEGNLHSEEVVYRSIGVSLKEYLGEKSLVLEGYYDKHVYKLFAEANLLPGEMNKWKVCQAGGVKEVPRFSSFLELAGQNCVFLTDSDEVALQYKKAHEEKQMHGRWVTYREVSQDWITTLEDFLEADFFFRKLEAFLLRKGISLGLSASDFGSPKNGRINLLKNKMNASPAQVKQAGHVVDELLKAFKRDLFQSVDKNAFSAEYAKMFPLLLQQ